MRRPGSVVTAALFALASHSMVQAQDLRGHAEQLYELARVDETMAATMDAFGDSFKASFDQAIRGEMPDITDEKLGELHRIIDEESALAVEEMQDPIRDLLVTFYMENFSEDELASLVEMQSSDVYQKQISLMPQVMQQTAKLNEQQMTVVQGRLSQRLRTWVEQNQ